MNEDRSSVFQKKKRLEKKVESKRMNLESYRKHIGPRKDECISVLEARKTKKEAEMKNCYWPQYWAKSNISSEILQLQTRIDELELLEQHERELDELEQQLLDLPCQGWGEYPGVLDENVVVEYRDKFRTLSVQMTPEVPFINIFMIGETGSGKSSLLRTFTTALTNKTTIKDIYRTSPEKSAEISVTKQIHLEKMYIGDEKLQLPCKFYDSPGIGENDTLTTDELNNIIDGKIKLGVDPQASSLANEVHCILYVVNATSKTTFSQKSNVKKSQKDNATSEKSVSQKSFEVITEIIKKKNHEDGVRQFVVVTHIDQLGVPNDDMKNAYKYPCIRAFCEKVSEAYGVDLLHVIPVSNYFEEVASNDAKNAMSLYNLWRVFESGKEYIERRIEDEERFFGKDDSQPTLKKLRWRCKSPTEKGIVEPILKATKITFEYGPPELNFFKFLAEETHFLWEKAKEIQSDNNEPMNSIVLIHDEDTEVAEHCLHYFDFDLPSKVLESADCLLNGKPEVICVFLLRETFWKATNIPFEQVLNNVVKKVAKANVFFMVSDEDISRAYDFCKKHNVCQRSNVISQGGDKRFFYDTFYDILERQMNSFLHALHTRTDTKDATIREELYSLIEQLRTRKIKTKPKLTTDCLARINESREFGVVGYRLLEKELFVFEDGPVKMKAEKRMHLENYIQKVFNGKVKIIPLREILKPHCAIECGSFITNSATNKGATIGIFGNMQNLDKSGVEKTVALSSPNLLSEGDHACLPNGENIGVCFWPVKPESQVENLCDVSIIEIDSSRLDTIKRTIFDKHIIVEEIPHEDLDYKQVFKYGAKTKTTYGWIKKINDFQLFESDVMVILPKSPAKSFSEEGDSGAIVVTKIKGNYYGVGMVYGSHFDLDNTTNNNAQIATIGIILKNALERFRGIKKMSIQFNKI